MHKLRQSWKTALAKRPRARAIRAALRLGLRKACVAGLLLGFLATTIGIPVYPVAPRANSAASHPCAGRGCGCDVRGDCWKSCCCFSLAQRVAWARRHDKHVPDDALAKLSAEKKSSVGQKRPMKACCAKPSRDEGSSKSAAAPRPSRRVTWQTGIAALKCRGLSLSLISAGVPLTLPPAATSLAHELPRTGVVAERAPLLITVAHDLPTPYG